MEAILGIITGFIFFMLFGFVVYCVLPLAVEAASQPALIIEEAIKNRRNSK